MRARAYIIALLPDGGLEIAWHANARETTTFHDYQEVPLYCHAGRVASVPSSYVGHTLVGERVCVYRDRTDSFISGVATTYDEDGGGHTLRYDTGAMLAHMPHWRPQPPMPPQPPLPPQPPMLQSP